MEARVLTLFRQHDRVFFIFIQVMFCINIFFDHAFDFLDYLGPKRRYEDDITERKKLSKLWMCAVTTCANVTIFN